MQDLSKIAVLQWDEWVEESYPLKDVYYFIPQAMFWRRRLHRQDG
jgi:hypothetical protein